MSTSNQTYKELAIPYFKEVFDIIDKVLKTNATPYYLIGASAIALELLKKGIKPSRGTKDIDFAVMVSSIDEYDGIVAQLEEYGFRKVEAPWTMYCEKFNVAIDILPFGEIEERDTESFNKRNSDLHLIGLKEILENAEEIIIEDKIAKIPPLPGMVLLKLVAWSDRPEERDSDLYDILKIIEHYFDHAYDEIVDDHYDIFLETDDFDRYKIASRVLGRKAKRYLDISDKLKRRISQVLYKNLISPETSTIAKEWTRAREWDIEYAYELLKELKSGLNER
jgi:predicted nucleotidyltransferase